MVLIPITVANGRGPWRGGDMRRDGHGGGRGMPGGRDMMGREVHIHHRGRDMRMRGQGEGRARGRGMGGEGHGRRGTCRGRGTSGEGHDKGRGVIGGASMPVATGGTQGG